MVYYKVLEKTHKGMEVMIPVKIDGVGMDYMKGLGLIGNGICFNWREILGLKTRVLSNILQTMWTSWSSQVNADLAYSRTAETCIPFSQYYYF